MIYGWEEKRLIDEQDFDWYGQFLEGHEDEAEDNSIIYRWPGKVLLPYGHKRKGPRPKRLFLNVYNGAVALQRPVYGYREHAAARYMQVLYRSMLARRMMAQLRDRARTVTLGLDFFSLTSLVSGHGVGLCLLCFTGLTLYLSSADPHRKSCGGKGKRIGLRGIWGRRHDGGNVVNSPWLAQRGYHH